MIDLDGTHSSGTDVVLDADVTHTILDSSDTRLQVTMEQIVINDGGADD